MAVKFRAVSTVTNTDGADASSLTVTKPSGTAEGDILILVTSQYTGDAGMAGVDAQGFKLIDIQDDGTDTRSRAYKKIATSSEPASYTVNFAGTTGAVNVSLAAFSGGYDVTTWANVNTTTANPASGYDLDCARDSVGWQVFCWRNDTANATGTWSIGAEKFDITAKASTAIRRGQTGMYYGPTDLNDIINAGDEFPSADVTMSTAPLHGIFWNFLIGDKAPDTEEWDATNGAKNVEIKMDRVELDATGSITTGFAKDITGLVSAFSASAQTEAASNAADGRASTNWLDDSTAAPQFLTYDFGVGVTKKAKRYRITNAATGSAYGQTLDPMNWTVQGSNNGTDWTVLDTRSNESFGNRSETREWRIADPGLYRYYKLNVTSNYGSAATVGCQIAEFRLSTVDVWEDITEYVQFEQKVRITRGLQGASGRSDFSRAYFTVKNTDGRFSLRNPNGAYHGALQRNSECRISKAFGTKSLQLQGAVQTEGTDMIGDCFRTPLTRTLQLTADLDVRIDLDMESWKAEQSIVGLGIDSSAPEVGWAVYMGTDGKIHYTWTESGEVHDVKSTVAVPDAVRQSLKVEFDANDGSGNSVVKFYTATSFNGTWVQLGETITELNATATIVYAGGTLAIGHTGTRSPRGIHGRVYNFELRDSIGGTLVADLDFTSMTNGTKTHTDSQGNMWIAVNNAVVSNRRYRFHGELATLPVAWDPTGNWIYADITAAGVQKRLERGNTDGSTMYRHHTKGIISDPGFDFTQGTAIAYWPMEDLKESFQCASAISGRPHLEIYGTPEFEAFSDFRESASLPDLKSAKFGGRIVGAGDDYIEARFLLDVPSDATPTTGANWITLWGNGTLAKFQLHVGNATEWDWHFFSEAALETGTPTHVSAAIPVVVVGEKMHVRVILQQVGADISITVNILSVAGESLGSSTQTVAGATFGRIYRVQVNDANTLRNTGIGFGHLAIYGSVDSPDWEAPINAHHYERAARRIARICAEEDIEFRLIGDADTSAFMGFQTPGSAQEIMSSAAVSDQGYLVDPLDAFGIEYRTFRSVLSRVARLTLSYTGNELSGELRPVDDDSHIVNDFTANRGDAGSARFVLDSGKLSVQAPPNGVGPYDDEQSYSLAHEGQCVDIASWVVHQGTLDEERYPRIQIALENSRITASTTLTEAILSLDIGYRVDVTDTPDFLPAQDIRQAVIGYEEWFDQLQHQFTLNTISERAFETALYSTGFRFDTAGSELYQDISSSETSVKVTTALGPEWTVKPAAIPIDWWVDGEQMRVTAIGRLISSNPFFDDNVTGWSVGTGTSVTRVTTYVHYYEQAVASMALTPNGVGAFADAVNANSAVGSVAALEQYEASAWVYSPAGTSNVSVSTFWRDSGGTFISTSSGTDTTIAAGVWTHISETFQAPAAASIAQMRVRLGGTPASSNVLYIYSARLIEKSEDAAQTFDSFNRADSTTNLGSTDDDLIQAWTQNSGTWGINGNAAYISAAATSIATVAGTADFERVEVTMSSFASGSASVIFRLTDTDNRCRFGGTVGTTPDLVFRVGGVDTRTEPASGYTLAAGDKLGIRAKGSVVEAFINDILVLTVSETDQQTATRVGMLVTTTVPRFNNFTFDPGTGPQTATVVRGVNGVSFPHVAGTEVELYRPPYRGM